MQEDVTQLAVRLIASSVLARDEPSVVRALTDQVFRDELDRRLMACGLVLLDNPYSAYVGIAVAPENAKSVFGREDRWLSNTLDLSKPDVMLLVVLWALLIIPKRERQLLRVEAGGQAALLDSPASVDREASESISLNTLLADFQHRYKPTYLRARLQILARHKFVVIEDGQIREGPRLDLVMDYAKMAPRIKDGILSDYRAVLEARRGESRPVDAAAADATSDAAAEGDADV
jgi:hypothetical protein